jgi:hypothetical protein
MGGEMSHNDAKKFPAYAQLIAETRKNLRDLDLDYLERQAVVTTRFIRAGEEVLIDYTRWGG